LRGLLVHSSQNTTKKDQPILHDIVAMAGALKTIKTKHFYDIIRSWVPCGMIIWVNPENIKAVVNF